MLGRIGSILAFRKTAWLAWHLLKDRRVPFSTKLILPGALFYLLFPVDLVPDFFPGFGQLDDLTVLILSVLLFVRMCPRELVREHLERRPGRPGQPHREGDAKTIEGHYEILE